MQTQVEKSWWDDTTDFLGGLWDGATDVIGQQWDQWLADEIGTAGGSPEKAIEKPQAVNADVSNAPPVAFGLTQNQLLIGGAVLAAGAFLLMKAK